jgi:hypothetical protein
MLLILVYYQPFYNNYLFDLQLNKSLIISLSGEAGSMKFLEGLNAVIIWSERKSAVSANFAAQLVFGGTAVNARLNQQISTKYHLNSGFSTTKIRLKYTVPEVLGINSAELNRIDEIAEEAIRQRATPSAVVLVVKDGNIIFNS